MVPLAPGPFWRVGYPWVGYLEGYPRDRVLPERTLDQRYPNPKGTHGSPDPAPEKHVVCISLEFFLVCGYHHCPVWVKNLFQMAQLTEK